MRNNHDSELVPGNGDVNDGEERRLESYSNSAVDEDSNGPIDSESSVYEEPSTPILHYVDSRDDMFVDASDELTAFSDGRSAESRASVAFTGTKGTSEGEDDTGKSLFSEMDYKSDNNHLTDEPNNLRASLKKTVAEKDSIARKYEEERETVSRELNNLCYQLKVLNDQRAFPGENDGELVDHFQKAEIGDVNEMNYIADTTLHKMIHECSMFIKNSLEERLQNEGTIRELNAILFMKDQEIKDLNEKVTELSVSREVDTSYLNSVQKVWSQSVKTSSEVQLEKDQHIEFVTNRMLASVASVVSQEELFEDSLGARINHLEKGTSLLIENHNQILYEINQLRQCLSEAGSDNWLQEPGTVLVDARDVLLDLKRKETELVEKLTNLEYENGKLVERLDSDKVMTESTNEEVRKLKTELEQEKKRLANTKEKLSLAVTKGKALVQQRDSLKQSLADKISELDKCLITLQEKSSAIEAVELRNDELVKSESLAASIQETLFQRNAILDNLEEILSRTGVSEELQSVDIVEKFKWLVDVKLVKSESLVAALQEDLMQRNVILEKIEQILLSSGLPVELQPIDSIEKFRWLLDERNVLKGELVKGESLMASLQEKLSQRNAVLENCEELLSRTGVSEELQSMDIVEKIKWLVYEKLVKSESMVATLQEDLMQRNAILEKIEEIMSSSGLPEELQLIDSIEKFRWLMDESNLLRSKLETTETLMASLQEMLSQRNAVLESFEEFLARAGVPEERQSMDIVEKIKWLVEEKLVKSESLVASLQEDLMQRNVIPKKIEEILSSSGVPEELQLMDSIEKFRWLVDERNVLKEELMKLESLIVSLQEMLSQRNAVLENFEELLSQTGVPEELQSMSIVEKFKWLVDEKLVKSERLVESLQEDLMQRNMVPEKIEEILYSSGVPEELQSMDSTEKFRWLVDERNVLKGELMKTETLMASLQETLSQRNTILENFEELLSQTGVSEELKSMDIVEKMKWLVDEKLVKSENLVASLQEDLVQRDVMSEKIEAILSSCSVPEELHSMNSIEKFRWLVDERNVLQGELLKSESLLVSLQETLLQRNTVLEYFEELLSRAGVSEELQSIDIVEKLKWIVDEKLVKSESLVASLQADLMQRNVIFEKIEEILFSNGVPGELQGMGSVEKLRWLVDERNKLIEELVKSESLMGSLQETLLQRNVVLEKLEELLLQTGVSEELQSLGIVEKLEWLVEEKLVKNDSLVVSLKEELMRRNVILEEIEKILSTSGVPEELHSVNSIEKVRWLVDERAVLQRIALEFDKLRDGLSSIDFPDSVSSSDIEYQVGWLRESFYLAKDEIKILQNEIATAMEAADKEIDHLTASISRELQEKDQLKIELDDWASKYKEVVEKVLQVSLERDQIVKMLVQVSGAMDMQEGDPSSDIAMVTERCIGKIKEQISSSFDSPRVDVELFQSIQSLLYIKSQDSMLCEQILEEDMVVRSQVNILSNDLRVASQEIVVLNEEKASLQRNLERSEDKSALLREKLSMAVKKGKGLVQDRENLKHLLDEKNWEIEKLMLKLQQEESSVVDLRDQINRLSTDLEHLPKLEADLDAMKDQRDQLEQFLSESNNMLKRVFESIDSIVFQSDSVSKEPLEKVKWLAGYFDECQEARAHAEEEAERLKQEAGTLTGKFGEAQTIMKSLEDALSVAENRLSQLVEEKRELEIGKRKVEEELHKAVEEAHFESSKFAEACATRKSIEDALSLAEGKISMLMNENEEALISRGATDTELVKVKEEVASQSSKLAEAYKTIKSLEDTLSQVGTNIALLTEQNNEAQVGRINLENEIKKLQDEAGSQASQLADACRTIKSLEDALLKAENDICVLEGEKKISEQEISTINSKLNSCMEELSGANGSLESRSVELVGHFNDLQVLMNDESLLYVVKQCLKNKFESLKDMDLILKSIGDHIVGVDSEALQILKEDLHVAKLLSDGIENIVNFEIETDNDNAADDDAISSYFRKIAEGFQMRNKILSDKFQDFSTLTDEFAATLLKKLMAIRGEVVAMSEHMETLKQKVKNMEMNKQEKENTIAMLENDVMILLSACTDATRELQFEAVNNLLEPKLLKHSSTPGGNEVAEYDTEELQQSHEGSQYANTAENLLFAARKIQTLTKQFEITSNVAAATIEDLQNKLEMARIISDKFIEERDLNQNRISKLESEVEILESSCCELRRKLENNEVKEEKLNKKEAELSSLHDNLLMKEKEEKHPLLSRSQEKTLLEKISGIDVSFSKTESGDREPHSENVKKLFYIIDYAVELENQMNLLSHDKEKLQSSLSAQTLQIEHLKDELESCARNNQDSESMKNELNEITFSLEKIIAMLGRKDLVGDETSMGAKGLLPALEKQVMVVLMESENLKSKAQELDIKLLGSQNAVDELTTKVKILEDSVKDTTTQSEIVLERSITEAPSLPTGSEISEIEDVGALGKSTKAIPTAVHVRTMRKGSTDHLAINIDQESDQLINHEEIDEDKGHVFKSLNASGLIPQQGKALADRIDGIWVSGGRILMNRPDARLGLIGYWLIIHLWLLATIL